MIILTLITELIKKQLFTRCDDIKFITIFICYLINPLVLSSAYLWRSAKILILI